MSDPNPSIPSSTLEYYQALPLPGPPPMRQRYWLHALLLVATFFTTTVVGARMEFNFLHNLPLFADTGEWIPFFPIGWVLARPLRLLLGIPFSATLIGTLGAVIRIKAPIRSRAALFDIGIAGPIAGFVVAIVTLGVAMVLSKPLAPGIGASEL